MLTRLKIPVIVGTIAVGSVVFVGLSRAITHGTNAPMPRPNLPAAHLPVVPLPASDRDGMSQSALTWAGEHFGITNDSFDQARLLGQTALGSLYLIFGEAGACLYLDHSLACGDPGASDEPALALGKVVQGGFTVGGGVVSDAVAAVSLAVPGKPAIVLPLASGAFVIPAGVDVRVNGVVPHHIHFIAN